MIFPLLSISSRGCWLDFCLLGDVEKQSSSLAFVLSSLPLGAGRKGQALQMQRVAVLFLCPLLEPFSAGLDVPHFFSCLLAPV